LKPVEDITRTARKIEESDLGRRIEVGTDDELGRLAFTLNQMIGRLERAFDRQRQFTADASHELRTPLAIIQAESTRALQKEGTATGYQESLEMISEEAGAMRGLIDRLLTLARVDSGTEPTRSGEINLRALVTDLASDAEVLCQEKGLQFKLGQLEDLAVKGDEAKLKVMFLGLLDNAVIHTPPGGTVCFSFDRCDTMAKVIIRDTGIGIPPEHLPHIFERFYRVDKARSRAQGGAGLGLAISKDIAESHGGRIEVESAVGEGSIFSVALPLLEQT
jgi:signal transduction histidine kinase